MTSIRATWKPWTAISVAYLARTGHTLFGRSTVGLGISFVFILAMAAATCWWAMLRTP